MNYSIEFHTLRVQMTLVRNYEFVHMSAVADQDDISYVSQIVFL